MNCKKDSRLTCKQARGLGYCRGCNCFCLQEEVFEGMLITVKSKIYSVAQNPLMDVNIITEVYPDEYGNYVCHKFFDWVQGCDITQTDVVNYILNKLKGE